jgi:hypothetical protein
MTLAQILNCTTTIPTYEGPEEGRPVQTIEIPEFDKLVFAPGPPLHFSATTMSSLRGYDVSLCFNGCIVLSIVDYVKCGS